MHYPLSLPLSLFFSIISLPLAKVYRSPNKQNFPRLIRKEEHFYYRHSFSYPPALQFVQSMRRIIKYAQQHRTIRLPTSKLHKQQTNNDTKKSQKKNIYIYKQTTSSAFRQEQQQQRLLGSVRSSSRVLRSLSLSSCPTFCFCCVRPSAAT